MNKQEAIEKIEELKKYSCGALGDDWISLGIDKALNVVKQLDEPEKPVVPKFVADWYEEHKDNLSTEIGDFYVDFVKDYFNPNNVVITSGFGRWFDVNYDTAIETLVKMKLFGYEVEKEKLYTVKFSNEDFGKLYIGIHKETNTLRFGTLPLNNEKVKSWFTEDELKRLKFWDNPAFETEEVKE